jgi:c(7)-type cytochrome triheme protein
MKETCKKRSFKIKRSFWAMAFILTTMTLGLIGVLLFFGPTSVSSDLEDNGGNILYESTKFLPPVLFSHGFHLEKGLVCDSCHPTLFKKKKGANAIDMKKIKSGQYCGKCHNGKIVFKTCKRCHRKKQ